jgi:hypothetical protein
MPTVLVPTSYLTARAVIMDALRFHLNRLSPGESLDPDTGDFALAALNNIVDEWDGAKTALFQEILTESVAGISSATATLGVDWPELAPGDQILGATVAYSAGLDVPLDPMTMAQYQAIAIKSTSTYPAAYAYDGGETVYFYPVPTGQKVTLRTRQAISVFNGLDTVYTMPQGYQSALAACLAALLAPTMNPDVLTICERRAAAARQRVTTQNLNPAIIGGEDNPGPLASILRGY